MIYKILNFLKKNKNWKNNEYFDNEWKNRIKLMKNLVENEETIMDLGCGKMWLSEYLLKKHKYIPVDYKKRGKNCLIYDFNKKQFPQIKVDLCFLSGVLEYIDDLDWFFDEIYKNSKNIILSYCTTDLNPEILTRKSYGWVNNLSSKDLINLISSKGFYLKKKAENIDGNEIFKFIKK